MCKCSWLNVKVHCVSATPLKRETAFCSSPDSTPTAVRGRGWNLKHLFAAGAREEPAAPEGICGASKPAGGSPALPWWTIQCKTVRNVSFHTRSLTLMQQNKVLQFTVHKPSVTKQESQLKTQGNARPPLNTKNAALLWSPDIIVNRKYWLSCCWRHLQDLKTSLLKAYTLFFLPNKKAARGLVQNTCCHRYHTRRQDVDF